MLCLYLHLCDLLSLYLLPGKIVWQGRGPGKTCLSLRGACHPRLPEDCMMLMMVVVVMMMMTMLYADADSDDDKHADVYLNKSR